MTNLSRLVRTGSEVSNQDGLIEGIAMLNAAELW